MENDQSRLTAKQKLAIYGILGLLGLVYGSTVIAIAAVAAEKLLVVGICAGALAGGVLSLPYFKLKLANYFLKKMKEEARKNPIETLQNEFIERKKSLGISKQRLSNIVGLTNASKERYNTFQTKHGERDEGMEKMHAASDLVITKTKTKIKEAEIKLEEFKRTIERENDRYQMALASGQLAAALQSAQGDDDPMRSFLQNEALDGVRTEFSKSMAEIDTLLDDHEAVLALPASQNVEQIEFSINKQEEPVEVRR